MTHKTFIGKNNILFLCNDSTEELNNHCNNLHKNYDLPLSKYTFDNYILFVYPNKSLIYKDYLPEKYIFKYRNALEAYNKKLENKIYDLYEILKYETDIYYKTDTHINIKGNYIVYKYFIEVVNKTLNLNIKLNQLDLNFKTCELKTLGVGIGDLTWDVNLSNQHLNDANDCYYFNDEITWFYCVYKIQNENNIRFLNYNLTDNTHNLEGVIVKWDNIISKYLIYIKNSNKIPLKILVFYDSFLLPVLPLYFYLFDQIYFIKNIYSNVMINLIKPDYVFEFRVERFL